MSDAITIGCAIGGGYALPTAVMMRSVLAHRRPDRPVRFLAVISNVPDGDLRRLQELTAEPGVTLEFLRPDPRPLEKLPRAPGCDQSTYYRLQLPDLAPHIGRAVWIDGDMLVLRDVGELYDTDLGGAPLGAVRDLVIPCVGSRLGVAAWRELGLDADQSYFNAGLAVMDLNLWREQNLTARLHEHLRSHRVTLYDQDALNALIGGAWKPLDLRWNVIASVMGRRFFRPPFLDAATLHELARDPWLLHYSGDWKPWTLPYGRPPYDLFFRYLDETPWRGWRPQASARSHLRAFYHERLRDSLYSLEWALVEHRVRGRR
jgi:lipopolysaccharide biosynthesis glycosyltransferase